MIPKTLKPSEVAARLGVEVQTLAKWRKMGIGPEFIQVGPRSIRYLEDQEFDASQSGWVRMIQRAAAKAKAAKNGG